MDKTTSTELLSCAVKASKQEYDQIMLLDSLFKIIVHMNLVKTICDR